MCLARRVLLLRKTGPKKSKKKFSNPLTGAGYFRNFEKSLGLKKSKFISSWAFLSEKAGGNGFLSFFWYQVEERDSATPEPFGPGAHVAQLVERVLGKDEVISSILIMGSIT